MAITRNGRSDRIPRVATLEALPSAKSDGDTYLVRDIQEFRAWHEASASWVEPISGIAAVAGAWIPDLFTIKEEGQTAFMLSHETSDLDTVTVEINGVGYSRKDDWTLEVKTLTWLESEFALGIGDEVRVRYIKKD